MKEECHFIGIGGIGMSGLARILLEKNITVSGSDVSLNYLTEALQKKGAKISLGHSASNIKPKSTVIFNSNIKDNNPEYQAALKNGCEVIHRSDLLKKLMCGYRTLSVTGTHGKTTTTSLLTKVLLHAKLDPSFAVGGILPDLKTNAYHGKGAYFIAEADESDGTFLKYDTYGAIVTNIDLDHLDHFKSENALTDAFETFMKNVTNPSLLFWCFDDHRLKSLKPFGVSYGFTPGSDLMGSNFRQKGWEVVFDARFEGKTYQNVEVSLAGYHNALNALAVFGLSLKLGIDEQIIREAFKDFQGVNRRCEKKGDAHGILFLDDYAHHPTEIQATLKAIRSGTQERRLILVYQPHRYTRTRDTLGQFASVFEEADLVIVTDIYAAGEEPIFGITHECVMEEIKKTSRVPCLHLSRKSASEELISLLKPHDVVVTMGAGDVTKLSGEILNRLQNTPVPKYKVGVVFGGRSVEHEVSLLSANHIIDSLRPEYYEQLLFGITKTGRWVHGNDARDQLKAILKGAKQPDEILSGDVLKNLLTCDVIVTVLHGTFGEDGMIQGFFEMLNLPYTGCDARSSAVSMDKALTKTLMLQHGVPTLPFVSFSQGEWKKASAVLLDRIEKEVPYPIFVKPAHLGSSVGISKATSRLELQKAIEFAFRFDTLLIAEKGVKAREIEFAVLGNDDVQVFRPGEIRTGGEIYTYEAKYGDNAMKVAMVKDLSEETIQKGIDVAKRAYQAAGCQGMARVDTFYDADGVFWLNEINPIPGFTKNSAYPWMCRENGLNSENLMDRLIQLALQRSRLIRMKEV